MPFPVTSTEELRASRVKGIAAYAHEQQVLLRLLRKRGQFTADEFDEWLYGREWRRPLRMHPIKGDSFLLGGVTGGARDWWLDLLQHMMALDLVDAKTENGVVVYRAMS